MPNVNLIRPDGSMLLVPSEDADKLKTLGYKEETPEQQAERNTGEGIQEYYTTPGQRAKTGVEGILSGASLGLSNLILDSEDTKERARYNPGYRLAGELGGAFLSPVSLVGDVAEGMAVNRGLGQTASTAIRLGSEGAVFGGAGALTEAKLKGDPVTAEAILAGMGWGSVWGGGLGALAGKAGAKLESAKLAEEEGAKMERAALESSAKENSALQAAREDKWQQLRSSVEDVRRATDEAVRTTNETLESLKNPGEGELSLKDRIKQAAAVADQGKDYLNQVAANPMIKMKGVRPATRAAFNSYKKVVATAEKGDYGGFEMEFAKFKDRLKEVAEVSTMPAPELGSFVLRNVAQAESAAQEVHALAGVSEGLKGFPVTLEGFRGMRPDTAERIGAALDHFTKQYPAELEGVCSSLKQTLQNFQEHLGVEIKGTPGTQFRGLWETVKGASKAKAVETATGLAKGENGLWSGSNHGIFRRSIAHGTGYMGEKLAERLGVKEGIGRFMAYDVAKNMAYGLLNIKGAVLGAISKKVAEWAPAAIKTTRAIGSKIEPLAVRLNGSLDDTRKSKQELMVARLQELHDAAPTVPDTLYKGIQPLSPFHPELAQAMHAASLAQFKALWDKAPKDPGNAFNALKSLYKPGEMDTEKFSRIYEVFHDPVGVMTRALETNSITPEAAEALREFWPESWQHFRVEMLDKVGQKDVWQTLGYHNQINIGLMLGVPVHSTMTPQFISSQMQMFTQRNQKPPMKPQLGAEGGSGAAGGRPGENREATQAQKITEH